MTKKLVAAAMLAAFVLGATAPEADAHSGSNRTQDQYLTLPSLFGGPKGPTPPPKFTPGPKPPPKLTPGPKPPPR